MDNIKLFVLVGIVAVLTGVGFALLDKDETELGALTGPDIISPYLTFGGVTRWAYKTDSLTAASTTCSFLSPAATSTLLSAGARFDLASTSAIQLEWGKAATNGANGYATTTSLGVFNLGASAQGVVLASSTGNGAIDPPVVFAPNTYLNLKLAPATIDSTGYAPTGTCHAVFEAY